MLTLNKKNIASLIIALIIAGGYLWAVLTPPSMLNGLPVDLYESTTSDPENENAFITRFNVLFVLVILIGCYLLARNFFTIFGYLKEKDNKNQLN